MRAFIIDWRPITERGVTTVRVVPTFDPFEHSHLGLRLTLEPAAVQEFSLERGKEALRHRIIVRVAHRAHRGHHAGLPATLAERIARVLASAIGMVDKRPRAAPRGSHGSG